jgi:hypothetical protein
VFVALKRKKQAAPLPSAKKAKKDKKDKKKKDDDDDDDEDEDEDENKENVAPMVQPSASQRPRRAKKAVNYAEVLSEF